MALSLYRKYRPNVFSDVVGQEHVEKTLVNAVREGTVAHAYLFCGPRGTGKTTSARLLAKALLCEKGPTDQPDGTCPQCAEIAEGTHPDVYELDAASRTGVENVREEIISRVQFAPTRGRYKVYIIDEVHMLSAAAFNALLKTLEEPPEHIVFVLCTTDPHKVPETIQSRCQRFDFRRFSIDEIVGYLQRICAGEDFTFEQDALEFIAAKANGGMRDATTSLEQVAVFTGGAITLNAARGLLGQMDANGLFEVAGFVAARDAASCFKWVADLVANGIDLTQCAKDLASHMRDLYVTALTGGGNGIVACPSADLPRYQQQAAAFGGPERLSRALTTCSDLVAELRYSVDARLSFEVALTRLCRSESELTLESLAERIESLEQGIPAPKVVAMYVAPPAAPNDTFGPGPNVSTNSEPVAAAPVPAPAPEPEPAAVDLPWEAPAEPAPAPAPAPEPQPVAAAPAPAEPVAPAPAPEPASSMSPARVLAAVLTEVKREDMATGALLNGVGLEHDNAGYHLVFPQGGEFAMRLAGHGDANELIRKAFETVCGAGARFDCRAAGGQAPAPAPAPVADFGTVSATDAAAPAPFSDAGYDAAQDSYYDAFAEYDAPVDEPPAFDPPASYAPRDDNDPYAALDANPGANKVDAATENNLADTLSVFGGGIKFEEM